MCVRTFIALTIKISIHHFLLLSSDFFCNFEESSEIAKDA